jgi:hypothetical protein
MEQLLLHQIVENLSPSKPFRVVAVKNGKKIFSKVYTLAEANSLADTIRTKEMGFDEVDVAADELADSGSDGDTGYFSVDKDSETIESLDDIAAMADEIVSFNAEFTAEESATVMRIAEEISDLYDSVVERVPEDVLNNNDEEFDDSVTEAVDEQRLIVLARMGLINRTDIPMTMRAIRELMDPDGRNLTPAQVQLVGSLLENLLDIVTGDRSIFSKIKSAL